MQESKERKATICRGTANGGKERGRQTADYPRNQTEGKNTARIQTVRSEQGASFRACAAGVNKSLGRKNIALIGEKEKRKRK